MAKCECGCGQDAGIYPKTDHSTGRVKGEPRRFIHGHTNRRPLEARFWEKVTKGGEDDCWRWLGADDGRGYGHFQVEGKIVKAHRVSFELHHGPIPDGAFICHTCDNPPCVNPGHLFLGSAIANNQDRAGKGRSARLRGAENGNSKLTADDVENIRANRMNLSQRELARLFGVAQGTISAIVRGKLWPT